MNTYSKFTLNNELVSAVLSNDTASAALALKGGSDANGRRRIGLFSEKPRSILHIAIGEIPKYDIGQVEYNYLPQLENAELTQPLLSYGAHVNARDEDGFTPLMIAAYHRKIASGRLLLNKGAYVNARSKHGYTALHMALNNKDIVALLLDYKADLYPHVNRARIS
jgi:ankyrin repeat protein